MSSDDLKNDSSRNTCSFNAQIFLLLSGERGVDFKTGEGKKFIYGAVNPPVTREGGSEKKRLELLLGMSYTSTKRL